MRESDMIMVLVRAMLMFMMMLDDETSYEYCNVADDVDENIDDVQDEMLMLMMNTAMLIMLMMKTELNTVLLMRLMIKL